MVLIDTNVLSELRKTATGRADPGVVAWAARQPADAMFVSVITLQELEAGVLRMERRDPAQGGLLRTWLDRVVVPAFADRILTVDLAVVRRAAALDVPDPRPARDGLIAATALVHGLTLVTRNVADFQVPGLRLCDPWQWQVDEDLDHG